MRRSRAGRPPTAIVTSWWSTRGPACSTSSTTPTASRRQLVRRLGARWNLRSNALRPATWTSADAAGLAILPGLVRYDEVAAGRIDHAIRLTVPVSRTSYLWPAPHQAGSTSSATAPAMGERFRLRATVDETTFPASVRPIIRALKTHGGIVADNGAGWFMSGVPDPRWDNDALRSLRRITGADFEAVDASGLMVEPTSGRARSQP